MSPLQTTFLSSYLEWWALYPATIRAASDPATAGHDSRPACDKAGRRRGKSSHDRRRRREKFVSGQAAGRRATVVSARCPDADAAAAAVDVTVGVAAAVAAAAAVDAGPGTGWEGGQGAEHWPGV